MRLSFPSPEFDDAVAAVCHGSASETQMRALNELLRGDAAAQDEYLMRVELHGRLASEPGLFSQSTEPITGALNPHPAFTNPRGSSSSKTSRLERKSLVRVLALAACIALVAGGAWFLWFHRPTARNGTTSNAVAMLTRAVDARWVGGAEPPKLGAALEPGWLRLESGLAQIVFYSGARLVIEGPTELKIVSSSEAACPTGRLLAEVPEPARGFRLNTAQVHVVDRGTAFGIDASRGQTEVHVFKGHVEFAAKTGPAESLNEGGAAVVRSTGAPRLMAADAAEFNSLFELQKRSLAAEAVRYDQWRISSARLNYDPSLLVHLDMEDLGLSEWTLHNAAGENASVPDATIVGCQRAEGRWPEKQALEFQCVNDRVRVAVPGKFESLTLSAWVRIKGLDRQFNSLFMCDGFEPGTIHWLIRNDGVLSLTMNGSAPGDFQILPSPPVLALDKFGMWTHLAVVIDGRAKQVTHYVNGRPVAHQTLKLSPPFHVGSAELGNWNARGRSNPTPPLIRNLSGSLDEFELFGRALTDGEVSELYSEGKPELDL